MFNPFSSENINAHIRNYITANHPSIASSSRIASVLDPGGNVAPTAIVTLMDSGGNKRRFLWGGTSQWAGSLVVGA